MERRQNTSPKSPNPTLARLRDFLQQTWRTICRQARHMKKTFLTTFTKWIDPKLENYRANNTKQHTQASTQHDHASVQHGPAPNPQNTEVNLASKNHASDSIKHAPDSPKHAPASTQHDPTLTHHIPTARVADLMLPPSTIVYVRDDEVLGPLTLDRLYKSGHQHFPVINGSERIIGAIHTTALNSLEVKETRTARDIIDSKVYYLRDDYIIEQALAAFLRTNCYFFLVINRHEDIVGMLTYEAFMQHLFGKVADDFSRDGDKFSVARRKL